jgi:hypothetical protein
MVSNKSLTYRFPAIAVLKVFEEMLLMAHLFSNVSSERILRACCRLFINKELLVQNLFPADTLLISNDY